MNKCLTSCRGCCKFEENERFFSPRLTDKEIERIKASKEGRNIQGVIFIKNSKNTFQIKLIKSWLSRGLYICPYLDEKTQLCRIYKVRPWDCVFSPFFATYGNKQKKKVLIVHFKKDSCEITDSMSESEFENYIKKSLDKWINEEKLIPLLKKYPGLICTPDLKKWDYTKDTFVVRELEI
jgi:Fe-S-cluster containining protein